MKLLERVHGDLVFPRRVRVLRDHIAGFLPKGVRVLDIGCGAGSLAQAIAEVRPDLAILGVDVLCRPGQTSIPLCLFDGKGLPFADRAFQACLLVDVLHHAADPRGLLAEAARVSRRIILVKDHLSDPFLATPRLRLLDRLGNARHGVPLPYNYWSRRQWQQAFDTINASVEVWKGRLGLYPRPLSWIFEDSLNFLACLVRL